MRNAFSLPLPFDNPLAKAVVMRQPEPALFSDHYYCTSSFCIAEQAGMLFVLRVSVTWKVVFVLLGYPYFQAIGEVAWQQLHLQTFMYFHCRKVGSSNQFLNVITPVHDSRTKVKVKMLVSYLVGHSIALLWMGALHDGFSLSQLQLGFCCRTGCKQLFLQAGHPRSQLPEYRANLIFTAYSNCHDNTAICLAKITVYLIPESKLFQSSYGNSGFQLTIFSCLSLCPSCVFELFFRQPSLYCRNATTIPLRPAQLTLFWVPWR